MVVSLFQIDGIELGVAIADELLNMPASNQDLAPRVANLEKDNQNLRNGKYIMLIIVNIFYIYK